jgi:hypothetical protein
MFDDQFFLVNGYKVLESDNKKFIDFRVLIILGHKFFSNIWELEQGCISCF